MRVPFHFMNIPTACQKVVKTFGFDPDVCLIRTEISSPVIRVAISATKFNFNNKTRTNVANQDEGKAGAPYAYNNFFSQDERGQFLKIKLFFKMFCLKTKGFLKWEFNRNFPRSSWGKIPRAVVLR